MTMTPAEFRALREFLGLSTEASARLLGVKRRAVERWESDAAKIPAGVVDELYALEAETDLVVEANIDTARAMIAAGYDRELITYRTDTDYDTDLVPNSPRFSASWHRAMCARVRREVPEIGLAFFD